MFAVCFKVPFGQLLYKIRFNTLSNQSAGNASLTHTQIANIPWCQTIWHKQVLKDKRIRFPYDANTNMYLISPFLSQTSRFVSRLYIHGNCTYNRFYYILYLIFSPFIRTVFFLKAVLHSDLIIWNVHFVHFFLSLCFQFSFILAQQLCVHRTHLKPMTFIFRFLFENKKIIVFFSCMLFFIFISYNSIGKSR